MRESIAAEDTMLEAGIEHQTVKDLIARIQEGEVDEAQLSAMVKVMNARGRTAGVAGGC